ncbi:hypothetical protein BJ741DRAFT_599182 [Chytriomyces cf. hyalinus JEL632]|nr:hypothetical protein BJ741DRAFT_599182 [Chytriomyces cf. hyalinus JEL632]
MAQPTSQSHKTVDKAAVLKMFVECPLPKSGAAETSGQRDAESANMMAGRDPAFSASLGNKAIDSGESLSQLVSKLRCLTTDDDPLASESIWRITTKAKTALPSGDRLENLSWRLLHMSLKARRDKDTAVPPPAVQIPATPAESKKEPTSPSMSDFFDMDINDSELSSSALPSAKVTHTKVESMDFGSISVPETVSTTVFSKQPIPPPQINKKSQLSFGSNSASSVGSSSAASSFSLNDAFRVQPQLSQSLSFNPSANQLPMDHMNMFMPTLPVMDLELDKQFNMFFPNSAVPSTFDMFANPNLFQYSSTAPVMSMQQLSSSLSSLQYSNTAFSSTASVTNLYSQTPPSSLPQQQQQQQPAAGLTGNNPVSPSSEASTNTPSPTMNAREPSPLARSTSAARPKKSASSARLSSQSFNPSTPQHHTATTEQTCFNCGTNTTPMWRRDTMGRSVCNACGVYFRVNGVNRVVKHGGTSIKRRVRVKEATPASLAAAAAVTASQTDLRRVLSVPDMKPRSLPHLESSIMEGSAVRIRGKMGSMGTAYGSMTSLPGSSQLSRSVSVTDNSTAEVNGMIVNVGEGMVPPGSLKRARFDM